MLKEKSGNTGVNSPVSGFGKQIKSRPPFLIISIKVYGQYTLSNKKKTKKNSELAQPPLAVAVSVISYKNHYGVSVCLA